MHMPYKYFLLLNRQRNNVAQETREGISYSTNVGLTEASLDITEIPPPIIKPPLRPTEITNATPIIYFDFEATGFGNLQLIYCLFLNIVKDIMCFINE